MKKIQRAYAVVADNRPPRPSASDLVAAAFARHQAGDVGGAATGYQAALELEPAHPDALHLLGVAAHQLGDAATAAALIEGSLLVNPKNADAASNLGNAYLAIGNAAAAETAYRRAIGIDVRHADAQYNLANVLQKSERYDEALVAFDAAIHARPDVAHIHFNRGNLLLALERADDAIAAYDEVRALDPFFPSLNVNRGAAFAQTKRWEEALDAFQAAVVQTADDFNALHNLGCVLNQMGLHRDAVVPLEHAYRLSGGNGDTRRQLVRALMEKELPRALDLAELGVLEADTEGEDWYLLGAVRHAIGRPGAAIYALEVALTLDPEMVYGSHHLASAYAEEGRLDESQACYEEMLARHPDNGDTWINVGLVIKDMGDVPQAITLMRRGAELTNNPESHSNLIFTLCYSDEVTAADIRRDTEAWAGRYAPHVPPRPTVRPREGRKIRVGYLSADFHHHPAGYLYRALFPLHDREKFEVVVYANQTHGDDVSAEIFGCADRWHMVKHLSDEELAAQVREDEIDIFIDLLGHTNNHRLPAFGLRPAPVQATWIGYFGTTGMPQMDYLICDQYTVPESEEAFYTERPARLPGCMYIFQPPQIDVSVNAPPLLTNGYPTFGCFNNTAKITPAVVELWSEVLRALPESRMILNRWPFSTASVRERFWTMFEACGIGRDRVELRATKGREAYFQAYGDVDIMLDTFPFGGGTTTSEALWMGVPVVSLPANRLVGHMTETILRAVGLKEVLVTTSDEFVAMATNLATNPDLLATMRANLRQQVEGSPLCDLPGFTKNLEGLYERLLDEAQLRA